MNLEVLKYCATVLFLVMSEFMAFTLKFAILLNQCWRLCIRFIGPFGRSFTKPELFMILEDLLTQFTPCFSSAIIYDGAGIQPSGHIYRE